MNKKILEGTYMTDAYSLTLKGKTYSGKFDKFKLSTHPFDSSDAEGIVEMYKTVVHRYSKNAVFMASVSRDDSPKYPWNTIGNEEFISGETYKMDGNKGIVCNDKGEQCGTLTFEDEILTRVSDFGEGIAIKITYKKIG